MSKILARTKACFGHVVRITTIRNAYGLNNLHWGTEDKISLAIDKMKL
jgi:hypothetical protein